MLLTEVAFRGRRQMLCRIGDGSGFLTLRFFHFTAQQHKRLGARRAHPLLRRSAPRPQGPGDRASGIPAHRPAIRANARRRAPHPDLSGHRGHHAGAVAPAGADGARSDRRERSAGLAAPVVLADSRLPVAARGAAVRAPAAGGRAGRPVARAAASGAAAARLRGAAGAPAVAEAAAAAHPERSRLAARAPTARSKRALLAALPFRPTAAQLRVLGRSRRISRCRNRCCASCRAMWAAARRWSRRWPRPAPSQLGRQVALMAPTELLADQHAQNFRAGSSRWASPWRCSPAGRPARRAAPCSRGSATGTRRSSSAPTRLFQEGVEFASLALVIVDEQHRFGVHQRLSLREKGAQRRPSAAPADHDGDARFRALWR